MVKKITNVFNYKLPVTRVNKALLLDPTESIFKLFAKSAKYIYKMGLLNDDWTEKKYEEAVLGLVSYVQTDYKVLSIEKVAIDLISESEVNTIRYTINAKGNNTEWEDHLYLLELESKKDFRFHGLQLVAVDPTNSHINRHGEYYRFAGLNAFKNSQFNYNRIDFVKYNADLLIGGYQLIKGIESDTNKIMQNSGVIAKSLFDTELHKMFFRLENAGYRRKGYKYLFVIDDDLEKVCDENPSILKKNDGTLLYPGGAMSYRDVPAVLLRNSVLKVIRHYLFELNNVSLQAAYDDAQLGKSHAKFFQTKKNIKKDVAKEMQRLSNRFDKFLESVELDNDSILNRIRKLAPSLEALLEALPKSKLDKKPILRFRKIQNHRALGLFTSYNNTIALEGFEIDKKNVGIQSFVHEYGHFLDYNSKEKSLLSLSDDFKPILDNTRGFIDSLPKERIPKSKTFGKAYLITPTEVFARAFETYVSYLGLDNSWIADADCYLDKSDINYGSFVQNKSQLIAYFDQTFPELRNNIAALTKKETDKENSKVKRNYKIGSHDVKLLEKDFEVEQLSLNI